MKYNFVHTDDIYNSILEYNNINEDELNKDNDFSCDDQVFIDFKNKLLACKDLRFLIVGDYDADGISATTIIKRLFNKLNINSRFYINSRIKDGYGLNTRIVDVAHDNDFDAIFLVDNGIVCYEAIDYAYSLGLKVYIIDHHEYQRLPKAESIIHSNLVSDKFSNLSAAGLCYILSSLFYDDEISFILGGIATLADSMPLIGFNRNLVKSVLNVLNTKNINKFVKLNESNVFTYHSINFVVIPKINSLSRMEPMGNPNNFVQFLLSDEENIEFIEKINYVNEKRKDSTKIMINKAMSLISQDDINVIASEEFEAGLCGLVSSRITSTIYKPSIVLAKANGEYKGSGRSLPGFDLYDALKGFNSFKEYGGHEQAVGLTIKEEDFNDFLIYVKNIKLSKDIKEEDVLEIDVDKANLNTLNIIGSLEPYGQGFKKPLFAIKNTSYKRVVVMNKYPKYLYSNALSAICFNEAKVIEKPKFFIGELTKDKFYDKACLFKIEDLI